MRRILLALAVTVLGAQTAGRTQTPPGPSRTEQVRALLRQLQQLSRENVRAAELTYQIAALHALLGETGPALEQLRWLSARGEAFQPADDPRFEGLRDDPSFREIVADIRAAHPDVRRSELAFTLPDEGLLPEGITHDPATNTFYIGSIARHKIVRVDAQGQASDFVPSRRDGLLEVLGLHVDVKRKSLWCVSNEGLKSAIHQFSLATGETLWTKAITAPAGQRPYLWNDFVVLKNGDLIITASGSNVLFRLVPKQERLGALVSVGRFLYPNGIAVRGDDLYVASFVAGLTRISMERDRRVPFRLPPGSSAATIDGLVAHERSLIAVQNSAALTRIIRLYLNKDGDAVERTEVLERGNPEWATPTTGVVANGYFYYIANSHVDQWQNGKLAEGAKLTKPKVMRVKL